MPNNWKTYKLADLTSVITKGTTPSTYGFDFEDSGINYIRAQSLSYDGTIDESAFSYISAEAHEKLKRSQLKANDILFSMAGAYLGMTGMVKESYCPANTNQAVGIIRIDNPNVLPKFVEYVLRNPSTVAYVNSQSGQSAQPNINLTEIGNLEFSFPPLPEQQAIAAILSSLDDKIELNLQMNKTLEEMAMALYKHWFVDFGPFRPSLEGGACKAGGSGEFVDSELGLIPEGWEVKSVYSIANFINGAAFKAKDFVEDKSEGLPVIKIAEIKQGITSQTMYSNKELDAKYFIENNDILFPWSGNPHTSLGIHLWDKGKALLNQHVFVVRVDEAESKCFVFNALKNLLPTFINLATHKQTTGLGHVTVANLKELKIPFPKTEALLKYNRQATSSLDLMYSNQIENIMLTSLRDTLLPKLISGAIRVKEAEQTLAAIL